MSLPRFSNVRKVEGLGLQLADLLKQLNDLKNREPEKYIEIVEVMKPIMIPEYVYVFKDSFIDIPYTKIFFEHGVLMTSYIVKYHVPFTIKKFSLPFTIKTVSGV